MPIIGFRHQGIGTINTPHGPKKVGLLNIRTSEREAAPADNFFWFALEHEKSVMKALRRLHPARQKDEPAENISTIAAEEEQENVKSEG